jgi:V/A-type H+-transporting ATPase subunit C
MDYGYVNARIRGMKSRLLDRHTLEDLIFQPDLNSLISDLEKTPYKEDIMNQKLIKESLYRISIREKILSGHSENPRI